jgi:GNAT superfamily N-acetyltransferase
MNVQINIRNMTRADLERVGEILFEAFNSGASKHGYAPIMRGAQEGVAWAWFMFRHGGGEFLIAEAEGRAAGICCLNKRGNFGGIGPVAIDPSYQGCGIGKKLMDAVLEKAEDLHSIRLFQEAFNATSFSLYYSLNFVPVAILLDLFLNGDQLKSAALSDMVSDLTTGDLDSVHLFDHPRSKVDRQADLAFYAKWGKVFSYKSESRIQGFLACLPGSRSVQLGPLGAETEAVALCLFNHALGVFKGRPCQARVMAKDLLLTRGLQVLGFKLYCLNTLMVKGAWRPGQYIETFGRFPEGV